MEIDLVLRKLTKAFILTVLCLNEAWGFVSSSPAYLPKIDTHTHIIPQFYKAILDSANLGAGIPPWDLDSHLNVIAEFNIVTSVLSVTVPGAKLFKDEPVDTGRKLARELNLYAKNLTVFYPKTFLFFATLTLPDVEGAVAEAIYALDNLGAVGVILEANKFGEVLGTRRYDPLYKVLNDRKAVVFVHPSSFACSEPAPGYPRSPLPPFVAEYLFDTVRAASELVLMNVTTDFPDITFILSHSGGYLPFAARRIGNALGTVAKVPTEADAFYEKLSQFNVDLAISATRNALPSTLIFFDVSKLTYGTDYPYLIIGVQDSALSVQMPPVRLSKKAIKKITYRNAYELFKKFLV